MGEGGGREGVKKKGLPGVSACPKVGKGMQVCGGGRANATVTQTVSPVPPHPHSTHPTQTTYPKPMHELQQVVGGEG